MPAEAYNPHPVQAEAHEVFLSGDKQRGTIFWGRRVGKTLWSIWHVIMASMLKQGNYWMVFDTRQHAKDVLWDKLIATIPPGMVDTIDKSEMTVTLNILKGPFTVPGKGWVAIKHNPDKLPSKIILTGSDDADRDRGGEADGIIFDEYQDQLPDQWEAIYEPFLATTKGWACFMGTAKGYNHWYDLMQHAQEDSNWFYSEAIWKDNPLISKEWIADSRKQAERRGKLDLWLREYELKFMVPQKSVYPMFDRNIHVKSVEDLPEDGTLYGVWDFGFAEGHPMAFAFILIDRWGKWWVTDEIFGTGIDMDEMLQQIHTKLAGRKCTGIIADSARPDLIDYARNKGRGLLIIAAPKRQKSVQAGITLLAARLKPKIQVTGEPEPDMHILRHCRNTVTQFESYQYKEAKEDRPVSEEPLKMNDDMPDAIRYLALYLKYGLVTRKKPLKSGVKTNQYGIAV